MIKRRVVESVVVFLILISVIGYFFFSSNQSSEPINVEENETIISYTDLNLSEAVKLIESNPDLIIIDVSPFYADGHIPGAINYYAGNGSLDAAIPTLDKNATYLVYCHFDSASIMGARILTDAGFTNVYRLEDHYAGWVNAGYPVEK